MDEHTLETPPEMTADPIFAAFETQGFDLELNLRGLTREAAEARLAQMLQEPQRGLRVAVLLDPPSGDGAESLFQPVGRKLLAAMRAQQLRSCRPYSPEEPGIGFVFEFA